jgi:hypothetical protein
VDVRPLVIADAATELIQPSKRPLDDPAPPAQPATVLGAAHSDQRLDMPRPQPTPNGGCLVAAIPEDTVWPPPARCQSRRRRQHVIPGPHPSSCGSICQGMPLRRTNRMPVRHARSETRGRPPFGRRSGIGKNGSTRSDNGSGSSAAAIPVRATSPTRIRFRRFCYTLLGPPVVFPSFASVCGQLPISRARCRAR